jgi:hypothetical protein
MHARHGELDAGAFSEPPELDDGAGVDAGPLSLAPSAFDPESFDPESLEELDSFSLFSLGAELEPFDPPALRLSVL